MKKVKAYIEKYEMIKKGDKVIAGVSGGADSVCLFFVLLSLQKEIGFSLSAVHVNHGLRGADADADERFVETLCREYGVPLKISRVNLELIAAKRKQSLEEAGRSVRREAFMQAMQEEHGNRIALAHHQNDNAETLLFHLARGTGITGLGGIRPVNGVWIRPLLCLKRQEIEAYLQQRKQPYCTDYTNQETEYTRNKLRHLVIPVLEEQINPAAVRHMNEAMEDVRELCAFAEQKTIEAVDACVIFGEQGCKIRGEAWCALPAFLKKEVIFHCMERVSGQTKDLCRTHVSAVWDLFGKQCGKSVNLPCNIRAVREYDGVRLERADKSLSEKAPVKAAEATEILIPGETFVREFNMKLKCQVFELKKTPETADIPQKVYTKWFDYDIIESCLHIRTRESKDSIVIDGAGHTQKLKSWFINEKIPAHKRAKLPLIADGHQVVWIPGYRMSSAYYVTERTRHVLQIEIEPVMPEH